MDDPENVYERMRAKADEIETELKRIGYWQARPPDPAALQFQKPFATKGLPLDRGCRAGLDAAVRDRQRPRPPLREGHGRGP